MTYYNRAVRACRKAEQVRVEAGNGTPAWVAERTGADAKTALCAVVGTRITFYLVILCSAFNILPEPHRKLCTTSLLMCHHKADWAMDRFDLQSKHAVHAQRCTAVHLRADIKPHPSRYSIGWVLQCMLGGLISTLRVLGSIKRSQWGP